MAVTGVFNCAGVDKDKFLDYTENGGGKATYLDWSAGEWEQQTAGKENLSVWNAETGELLVAFVQKQLRAPCRLRSSRQLG